MRIELQPISQKFQTNNFTTDELKLIKNNNKFSHRLVVKFNSQKTTNALLLKKALAFIPQKIKLMTSQLKL